MHAVLLKLWLFKKSLRLSSSSNKSDIVSVEYSTFFSSSYSACGWVEMEAEMERQACSCVFVSVDLKSPWIWAAVFGIVQSAHKCISCVLACPVPRQSSHLTSSLKECSGSTEFEAGFWLPQNPTPYFPSIYSDIVKALRFRVLIIKENLEISGNFKIMIYRSGKIMETEELVQPKMKN